MRDAIDDVKACREALGLSQPRFAERYGLHPATYRQWEQGRRKPDLAAETYLRLIAFAPAMVAHLLPGVRASETACARPDAG